MQVHSASQAQLFSQHISFCAAPVLSIPVFKHNIASHQQHSVWMCRLHMSRTINHTHCTLHRQWFSLKGWGYFATGTKALNNELGDTTREALNTCTVDCAYPSWLSSKVAVFHYSCATWAGKTICTYSVLDGGKKRMVWGPTMQKWDVKAMVLCIYVYLCVIYTYLYMFMNIYKCLLYSRNCPFHIVVSKIVRYLKQVLVGKAGPLT